MKSFLLILAFFFLGLIPAFAESTQPTMLGRNWKLMNAELKSATLLVQIKKFQSLQVPLSQKPGDYANAVEWMMLYEPASADWTLGTILATYLYENEPKTRTVLDRLGKEAVA